MSPRGKGRLAPFVPVDLEMMNSPAWRATSFGARWLYMHLKRRYSFKQKNNGRLWISDRDAEEEMGGCRDSISRWFRELQFYGFIVMTEAGCLGVDGKGKAPHWRLTEYEAPGGRNGNTLMLPTKDYLKWDGTKFRDDRGAVRRQRERRERERGEKKQNPGPQIQARVARKYRPGPARKCGPLSPATGPQIQAISDTSPGPQIQAISSSTTLQLVSAADRKPWKTPTLTGISFDELVPELQTMALELKAEAAGGDSGWIDWPAQEQPEVRP